MPACLSRAHRAALMLWRLRGKVPVRKSEESEPEKCRACRGPAISRSTAEIGVAEPSRLRKPSVRRSYSCAAIDCPVPGGSWVVYFTFESPHYRTWRVRISRPVVCSARRGYLLRISRLEVRVKLARSQPNHACHLFLSVHCKFLSSCTVRNCAL